MNKNELLRQLPQIDQVLRDQRLFALSEEVDQEVILEAVREVIEEERASILEAEPLTFRASNPSMGFQPPLQDQLIGKIMERAKEKNQRSLRKTINATGIILHTNLGRARLSDAACRRVLEVAGNYSSLEYNVKEGSRGSRNDHVEELIKKILGVEAALVVNNNAAATTLCLASMAVGREVVVSRGELVEIGGSFRIPEIMKWSGAELVEIGTTNKTRLKDYAEAIHVDKTGVLMKVHTSNYKIVGFTEETTLPELVRLGREKHIPVVYDLGSGLMINLKEQAIQEPTVPESLQAGVDVILFSGDKMFGGPQAGIIAGRKKYVEAMRSHPLARIVRADKMTLAALEETLRAYRNPERALVEIPVLTMLAIPKESLREKANQLASRLEKAANAFQFNVLESEEQVGGGSAPTMTLTGYAVTIQSDHLSLEKLEKALREWTTPIIIRAHQGKAWIHVKTITGEEAEDIVQAFSSISEKILERI